MYVAGFYGGFGVYITITLGSFHEFIANIFACFCDFVADFSAIPSAIACLPMASLIANYSWTDAAPCVLNAGCCAIVLHNLGGFRSDLQLLLQLRLRYLSPDVSGAFAIAGWVPSGFYPIPIGSTPAWGSTADGAARAALQQPRALQLPWGPRSASAPRFSSARTSPTSPSVSSRGGLE